MLFFVRKRRIKAILYESRHRRRGPLHGGEACLSLLLAKHDAGGTVGEALVRGAARTHGSISRPANESLHLMRSLPSSLPRRVVCPFALLSSLLYCTHPVPSRPVPTAIRLDASPPERPGEALRLLRRRPAMLVEAAAAAAAARAHLRDRTRAHRSAASTSTVTAGWHEFRR